MRMLPLVCVHGTYRSSESMLSPFLPGEPITYHERYYLRDHLATNTSDRPYIKEDTLSLHHTSNKEQRITMLTVFSYSLPLSIDDYSAKALLKIVLLLITGFSVHLSLSPPNPPASPKHCLSQKTFFERCVRWVTFCSKAMVWIETLCDAFVTTAQAFPSVQIVSTLAHILCPFPPTSTITSPSLILIIGALCTNLGALLRLACFRTLGSFFTFELAITPAHALITVGPYATVRHPSYTGVYLTLLGASAVGLAPGAWLRECWLRRGVCAAEVGIMKVSAWGLGALALEGDVETVKEAADSHCATHFGLGGLFAWSALAFWTVKVAYALRSTHRRLATEDAELHRVFGSVWEAYAKKVRWRLVPWVY
ncbi:hypothetical protein AcV5_003047 [Taiwanofungus camphoratus]|nr:hypothetical protein AcV5_003047 [Antrodia cinnamomea]KAI0916610.1 hypothetical protein AcV5_003047 [Antrodia cinnamomea]